MDGPIPDSVRQQQAEILERIESQLDRVRRGLQKLHGTIGLAAAPELLDELEDLHGFIGWLEDSVTRLGSPTT